MPIFSPLRIGEGSGSSSVSPSSNPHIFQIPFAESKIMPQFVENRFLNTFYHSRAVARKLLLDVVFEKYHRVRQPRQVVVPAFRHTARRAPVRLNHPPVRAFSHPAPQFGRFRFSPGFPSAVLQSPLWQPAQIRPGSFSLPPPTRA